MGITTTGCDYCGLIQTNPRPSEKGLNFFYENHYRQFYQKTKKPSDLYLININKQERMKNVVDFLDDSIELKNINSILDFGSSEGAFFTSIINNGFSPTLFGVEPNQDFAKFSIEKNNAKIFSNINQLDTTFDLIVLIHVFEHLLFPDKILQKLNTHLNENGFLYIDVPNADKYSSLSDLHIGHIFHFTTRTLKRIISQNGFDIIVCEEYNPPHHPKSIRILAQKKKQPIINLEETSKSTEANSWKRVVKISYYKFYLKFHLSRNRYFKTLYKKFF